MVKGYIKYQSSESHFSQSFLSLSVSPALYLTRKRIDNPDLYPIQLQILVDNGQYLKFKLLYDEETDALKLVVNDVPFEQLDFRSASLAP